MIIACWSGVNVFPTRAEVMCQFASTFERRGSSKGRDTIFRCSGVRLLCSVVTRVSDEPDTFGAAEAARATAPRPAVVRKVRRSGLQSGHYIVEASAARYLISASRAQEAESHGRVQFRKGESSWDSYETWKSA